MVKKSRFPSVSVVYFLAKANSVFLGLVFSILYSRALGPESKGILTVVFLSTVLFSQIINGGIDLSFRSRLNGIRPEDSAPEYFIFSTMSSLLVTAISLITLQVYAHLKVPIAGNYFVVSIGYVFLAVLSEQMTQYILSLGNLRSLWKIEMPTIFFQMATYLVLVKLSIFSTAVSVLISFSFSYLVIIFRGYKVILGNLNFESLNRITHLKVLKLLRTSKNNFFYNFLLSFIDRFDRLIVLWVFSSSVFGKYSVATGIILTARFFPETIGNLILGNQSAGIQRVFQKFKPAVILILFILPIVLGIVVKAFIAHFFGNFWAVGLLVIILFGYSELFRAIYFVQVNRLLHDAKRHTLHFLTALFMVFVGLCAGLVAYLTKNLAIVPAGMLFGYLIVSVKLIVVLNTPDSQRNS
jgi:O-antigen/teichoic acid export membrane protein